MYFKNLIVSEVKWKLLSARQLFNDVNSLQLIVSNESASSSWETKWTQCFVYEYNRLYIPTFIIHLSSVNLIRIQDSHGYFNSTANPFTTASRKVVFYLQLGRYLVRRYVLCFVCFDIEFIWGIVIVVCECKTISGTCFERYRNQY